MDNIDRQKEVENILSVFCSDYWRFVLEHEEDYVAMELDEKRNDILNLLSSAVEEARSMPYRERNQLVAHLSKQHPAYIQIDPAEPDWPVIYIETPAGQMSWHIGKADLDLFEHLPYREGKNLWDGHTTEEKYNRLKALSDTPGGD